MDLASTTQNKEDLIFCVTTAMLVANSHQFVTYTLPLYELQTLVTAGGSLEPQRQSRISGSMTWFVALVRQSLGHAGGCWCNENSAWPRLSQALCRKLAAGTSLEMLQLSGVCAEILDGDLFLLVVTQIPS